MKTETTLVRAKSRVELDTISLVDLADALVVFPDHAELDDALGNRDNLQSLLVLGVLLEERGLFQGGNELCNVVSIVNLCTEFQALAQWQQSWRIEFMRPTLTRLLKLRLNGLRHGFSEFGVYVLLVVKGGKQA